MSHYHYEVWLPDLNNWQEKINFLLPIYYDWRLGGKYHGAHIGLSYEEMNIIGRYCPVLKIGVFNPEDFHDTRTFQLVNPDFIDITRVEDLPDNLEIPYSTLCVGFSYDGEAPYNFLLGEPLDEGARSVANPKRFLCESGITTGYLVTVDATD